MIQLSKLARQHHPQLGSHFVAQPGIALSLGRLPLQRIHLSRHFFKNVIDPRKILLGIFETRLSQPFLGLEFGDARGLFDNGPAICGTAAQNLANASLLNQRVGLRSQARTHKQFLDVPQPAQFPIQQVFAISCAK